MKVFCLALILGFCLSDVTAKSFGSPGERAKLARKDLELLERLLKQKLALQIREEESLEESDEESTSSTPSTTTEPTEKPTDEPIENDMENSMENSMENPMQKPMHKPAKAMEEPMDNPEKQEKPERPMKKPEEEKPEEETSEDETQEEDTQEKETPEKRDEETTTMASSSTMSSSSTMPSSSTMSSSGRPTHPFLEARDASDDDDLPDFPLKPLIAYFSGPSGTHKQLNENMLADMEKELAELIDDAKSSLESTLEAYASGLDGGLDGVSDYLIASRESLRQAVNLVTTFAFDLHIYGVEGVDLGVEEGLKALNRLYREVEEEMEENICIFDEENELESIVRCIQIDINRFLDAIDTDAKLLMITEEQKKRALRDMVADGRVAEEIANLWEEVKVTQEDIKNFYVATVPLIEKLDELLELAEK